MEIEEIVLTEKQSVIFTAIHNAGHEGWYIISNKENSSVIRVANTLVRKEIVRSKSMLQGYAYWVKTWKDALP